MDCDAKVVQKAYERLSAEDRKLLEEGLTRIHGRQIGMTLEELEALPADDLGNIYRIIEGIHLTRQYVPDLRAAYQEAEDLPSRVSFGYIERDSTES